ncbi:hypothetical protein [Aeromonas phage AerS_266]|nr:hypothetical protein [Aeromonas phage AerS_266]
MENNTVEVASAETVRLESLANEATALLNEMGMNKDAVAVELDKTLGMTNNMMGAVIGAGLATGLELISPTGTRASAAAAALTGVALIYATRKAMEHPYQNKLTGAVTGLISFKLCKTIGRNVVEYFPAQKETVELVQVETIDNVL